jgi:hypothetical protein
MEHGIEKKSHRAINAKCNSGETDLDRKAAPQCIEWLGPPVGLGLVLRIAQSLRTKHEAVANAFNISNFNICFWFMIQRDML